MSLRPMRCHCEPQAKQSILLSFPGLFWESLLKNKKLQSGATDFYFFYLKVVKTSQILKLKFIKNYECLLITLVHPSAKITILEKSGAFRIEV